MANGDDIPPEHHVARYCFSSEMVNGQISAKNFKLRSKDRGKLSSDWVECNCSEDKSTGAAVKRLRGLMRNVDPQDRIVILNVGQISQIKGQQGNLKVVEDAVNSRNSCHAAIMHTGQAVDNHVSDAEMRVTLALIAMKGTIIDPN